MRKKDEDERQRYEKNQEIKKSNMYNIDLNRQYKLAKNKTKGQEIREDRKEKESIIKLNKQHNLLENASKRQMALERKKIAYEKKMQQEVITYILILSLFLIEGEEISND
jgi:hypothetical protein